jgi:hypothetical protein
MMRAFRTQFLRRTIFILLHTLKSLHYGRHQEK